ncbi:hypothetical protein BpHYR1_010355 [Brachionus plicatilis]|uniref:Uncharacterized protein n=1 Tax=Brachionus plicatilis TaxID=10195 RepID=A0A3M7QDV7_BRAPC|nr:hypothetical protein BpHYR1_010355 [Brachionus plicatilis]
MTTEKVSIESELKEILESYSHLFDDSGNQYQPDNAFYSLKQEDFLIKDKTSVSHEIKEVGNANSEQIVTTGEDDAAELYQNLSENYQSNDTFIEELKDCIQKINEKKRFPVLD